MDISVDRSLDYTSDDDTFHSAVGTTPKLQGTVYHVLEFCHEEDAELQVGDADDIEVPSAAEDTDQRGMSSATSFDMSVDGQFHDGIANKNETEDQNAPRETVGWIPVPAWVRRSSRKTRLHLKIGDVVYAKAAPRKGMEGTYWWLARIVAIRDSEPEESKCSFKIRYGHREETKNGDIRLRYYKTKPEWVPFGALMLDSDEAETTAKRDNEAFNKQRGSSVRQSVRASGRNTAKTGSKKRA